MEDDPYNYIPLQEATKFCNYSQEYLSLRARQGKLKAMKFGRNWVTKKEWLEEYLKTIEDYYLPTTRHRKKTRVTSEPPEELEKVIERPKLLPKLRFAFSLVLVLVLLAAGGVFGKTSFQNVYQDLSLYICPVRDFVVNSVKEIPGDISNGASMIGTAGNNITKGTTKFFNQSFIIVAEDVRVLNSKLKNYSSQLAAISATELTKETFKIFQDFGNWVSNSLKIILQQVTKGYLTINDFIEEKILIIEIKILESWERVTFTPSR